MAKGEINRFLHIFWNVEYVSKVDNYVAYKLVIVSKIVMISLVVIVAFSDPVILQCQILQSYLCARKVTALHHIISTCLSFIIMISVCVYFIKKVYFLSKVHPQIVIEDSNRSNIKPNSCEAPIEDQPTENENAHEENVIKRLNQNPNQFFKVKISKATDLLPPQQEKFPILRMVKKALIVNLVSLCQMAFLLPFCVVDIILIVNDSACDDEFFNTVIKSMGIFSLIFFISFPICLEKKLDRFTFH